MRKLVFLLLMVVLAAPALCQDFNSLAKTIDKMDASLKRVVDAEKAEREKQIKSIQHELGIIKRQLSSLYNEPSTDLAVPGPVGVNRRGANKHQISELASIKNEIAIIKRQLSSLLGKNSNRRDLAVPGPVNVNRHSTRTPNNFGGLEISAFFDVVGSHNSSADDNTEFAINQAELDLEHQLNRNMQATAAIAYNNFDGGIELATAYLEINILNNHNQFVNSLDVTAGQFYVPFGIDNFVFTSPERKLVTAPQVVQLTHGGWNDFGFQFHVNTEVSNLVIFGVNGFTSSADVLDEVASLALGEDVFEEIDTTPSAAFGSRLGLSPLPYLEFGGSVAVGVNQDSKNEMLLSGADVQFSMNGFELKGEYIYHSLNRSLGEENNRGYYLQSTYNFLNNAFITGRWGSFKPDNADWNGQFSFGAGYELHDGVEIRFQTLISQNSNQNTNFLQLVAGF